MESAGTTVTGGVSSIRKEVSLSRSHSDSSRRNRPYPGNNVVRHFQSTDELEKLQVCQLIRMYSCLAVGSRDVVSVSTSWSCGNVGRSRSRSRLGLKIKRLGLVSVSYHRVWFTSQYARLFASLQKCT